MEAGAPRGQERTDGTIFINLHFARKTCQSKAYNAYASSAFLLATMNDFNLSKLSFAQPEPPWRKPMPLITLYASAKACFSEKLTSRKVFSQNAMRQHSHRNIASAVQHCICTATLHPPSKRVLPYGPPDAFAATSQRPFHYSDGFQRMLNNSIRQPFC